MARSCEDASDWIDRVVCLVTTDATWAGVAVAIVGVLLTLLALVTGVLRWIVERIKPRAAPEPNEIVDSLVELYRLPDVKDTEQLRSQRNSLKEMVTMLRERMLTSSREERARIIVAMTALRNGEIEPAEKLFGKILDEKSEIGNAAFEDAAKAARNLGELQFLRNIPEAVRSYEQAVELDPVNLRGWNRLGHFRRREGKPGLALEAFNKVLEIGQSEGDRNAIALATGNLGLVNQDLGDLGEAERLHREALKLNSDLGKEDRQADNYSNLGFVFQERGELNRAEEYHRMALRIDEKLENKEEMAIDYGRLGRIH